MKNIELIEARCRATLAQVEKIKALIAELEVLKSSEYYTKIGDKKEQDLDIKAKEAEINNQELILMGMLK